MKRQTIRRIERKMKKKVILEKTCKKKIQITKKKRQKYENEEKLQKKIIWNIKQENRK